MQPELAEDVSSETARGIALKHLLLALGFRWHTYAQLMPLLAEPGG